VGHDDSEEEDDQATDGRQRSRKIGEGQERQVRHPPVSIPDNSCPFENDNECNLFFTALDHIKARGVIPVGFGLEKCYESLEVFSTGRSKKGLSVPLDYDVWYPRVLLWCQALDLLKRFGLIVRGE